MRMEPKDTFQPSSRLEFSSNSTGWDGYSWITAGRVLTAGLNHGQGTRGLLEPPINAACPCLDRRNGENLNDSWYFASTTQTAVTWPDCRVSVDEYQRRREQFHLTFQAVSDWDKNRSEMMPRVLSLLTKSPLRFPLSLIRIPREADKRCLLDEQRSLTAPSYRFPAIWAAPEQTSS